jgi:glycosyltransferase involved in cell wall biosynthesis
LRPELELVNTNLLRVCRGVQLKLIIQIPCFNEADAIGKTIAALPRSVQGIDEIEVLVVDDGSTDGTSEAARNAGAKYIVRHRRNRGLAAAFQSGIEASLEAGADVIVNTDADNQYEAEDIPLLIAPILQNKADIVVGDRQVSRNEHFSSRKRLLQVLGSTVVRRLARVDIPDAVSGFRSMTREAASQINILSTFSYTTEMLIFAGKKRMAITSVPVRTNAPVRDSRLFRSIPQFLLNTGITIARVYTLYNPLRTFASIGLVFMLIGLMPVVRFVILYLAGDGAGHIQSLVIGGTLLVIGFITSLFGIIADLIGRNRQMLEMSLVKLRQMEERMNKLDANGRRDE